MQRLITEIWISLALAAVIGGLVVWSLMRLWVAQMLTRRDHVTMARIKAVDEAWADKVWTAEEDRNKAQERLVVMDERLADALEHADALEVQVRSLGATPIGARRKSQTPSLTVRIRNVIGSASEAAPTVVEVGSRPVEGEEVEITGLELQHVDVLDRPTPNGLSETEPAAAPAPRRASPVQGQLGETDDLTRIEGVGFGYAARLNALGYWRFDQIAAWKDQDIERVAQALGTPAGRIRDADWISQARRLIGLG